MNNLEEDTIYKLYTILLINKSPVTHTDVRYGAGDAKNII